MNCLIIPWQQNENCTLNTQNVLIVVQVVPFRLGGGTCIENGCQSKRTLIGFDISVHLCTSQ